MLSVAFLVLIISYIGAYQYFKDVETDRAESRLSLYESTLSAALEQFQHVPFMLAHDTFVIAGAEGHGRDLLNIRLAEFADQARLDAIYLMDMQGLTIATSNWNAELTFLGQNYGFRPYFQQAASGERGSFFAVGATTSRPGYFIAEPVRSITDDIIGVIAIKVNLTNLTDAWSSGGESVFVSNADGIVILASEPAWRYRAIGPLNEKRRQSIIAARQFGDEPLAEMNWDNYNRGTVNLDGRSYLHVETSINRAYWTLHYLANIVRVTERAGVFVASFAAVMLLSLAIAIFQRSQRIRIALESSQAERRTLRRMNSELEQEIEDRRKAERRLSNAQQELAAASRLAVLGQLSASVTHELGQPIAAMRNYLTAAEFDEVGDPTGIFVRLGRIATRMESITKQLKFFASPSERRLVEVDLRRLVEGAEVLLGPDFKSLGITVHVNIPSNPVIVKGNRLRLEQVLVNLVRNSIDATAEMDDRVIWIEISSGADMACVSVGDNGHGLSGQATEQLLEPFHTTRASGQGMGLGLAISSAIINEHNGTLSANNREGGGAIFTMQIPLNRSDGVE
ncbi:hypothetical protein A9Q96_16850 [Rhodobacterales bacterium 52_120_T64]|nr:hypothetical protein A9Q96_16850 [Rhodobacterales bacterium 52_120_T64]